jgi:hypothetical protein
VGYKYSATEVLTENPANEKSVKLIQTLRRERKKRNPRSGTKRCMERLKGQVHEFQSTRILYLTYIYHYHVADLHPRPIVNGKEMSCLRRECNLTFAEANHGGGNLEVIINVRKFAVQLGFYINHV